eukprot:1732794-Amphidinium_carterae.1
MSMKARSWTVPRDNRRRHAQEYDLPLGHFSPVRHSPTSSPSERLYAVAPCSFHLNLVCGGIVSEGFSSVKVASRTKSTAVECSLLKA